ncbi:MAG: hypothetical protein U0S50_03320 [Sphingopyxis sp.]|uniref:hypothetical protein n=1 Tax=Sphingopyxis sp. TaxID=1908224 RepID=UPI002ABB8345|nr:hypothetical protein [Sphingopyxis sp.]MDZ3830834.1 hypothetical protein [Sphingopyxis sp.]
MTDIDDGSLQRIWQADTAAFTPMDADQLQWQADRFGDAIIRRNRREYVAAGLCVIFFGATLWILPGWLLKAGSLLIILASLFVAWQLSRRTSRPDPVAAATDVRTYFRDRLETEAQMLEAIGRWYLAPLLPGLGLFLAGQAIVMGSQGRIWFIMTAGTLVLLFTIIWLVNRRAAAQLRQQMSWTDPTGYGE